MATIDDRLTDGIKIIVRSRGLGPPRSWKKILNFLKVW
jgi:hypothetical protein